MNIAEIERLEKLAARLERQAQEPPSEDQELARRFNAVTAHIEGLKRRLAQKAVSIPSDQEYRTKRDAALEAEALLKSGKAVASPRK